MKRTFFLLISIYYLLPLCTKASDSTNIYQAETIRKELKENANSVKRFHRTEIEVSGPDRAILKVRDVTTVLNAKDADELAVYFYTDKFRILEDIDLKLYDANGNLIERHRKKDLSSNSAGSGLVEDGKLYFLQLSASSYPVTIEQEYTIRFRGVYQLPGFYFSEPYQSVEYTSMFLKYPASLQINHKLYNINIEAKKIAVGNDVTLQWEASNLLSTVHESNSGDWRFNVPSILFNMNKFEYDGYAGDMSSWRNLGLWYNYLVGNTNKLSARYQEEIRQMVAPAKDDKEKVRLLYQNLQKNFRYVSIQLGIGGLKPFPADFVHEKKYGDCKGLSNYMEACLSAVGIKSYNAWVKSGDNDIMLDADFPQHGFDHQILLVLAGKDSIWLECTSNYNDFGHLGSFTENRYALVMTEAGGRLIRTPVSRASANLMRSRTTVKLNDEGNAAVESEFNVSGEFKYLMFNLSRIPSDKQKSYFINYFGMNQPDEFAISYDDQKDTLYTVRTQIVSEKGYDFKAGSKIFMKPRIYKNWTVKLPDGEKRTYDYFIDHPFIKSDTTVYILPAQFSPESIPKNSSFNFSNGNYEARYWFDGSTRSLYSVSTMTIFNQRVPASKFQEAKKFFDQVLEDGNQKIILVSNN